MKTILRSLLAAFMLSAQASAQITLGMLSYPAVIYGTDTASVVNGNIGPIPTGANASWDLTGVTYTTLDTPYAVHDTGYYTYYDEGIHFVSPFLYFHVRLYNSITNQSFAQVGEHVYTAFYPLYGLIQGANPNDSLNFHGQDDIYTTPLTKVHFYATYDSNWSSNYVSNIYDDLTYGSIYYHDSGLFKQYNTELDSVIGWGKMRVKESDGSASGYMDVLEVKVIHQQTDSFFIAGSLAPDTVLANFGLVQGSITNTYEYKFYRTNEVTPLADVFFADSTFSANNVSRTIVHMQRLAQPVLGVNNVTANNEVNIFPNPVYNHTLFIDAGNGSNGTWSYQLINTLGVLVNSGSFPVSIGITKYKLQIPADICAGIYYLKLNKDGGETLIKPVNIAD
jgi:hypothetical protein